MKKIKAKKLPKAPKLDEGKVRVWFKCPECKIIEHMDFKWYPFANPPLEPSCGHVGFGKKHKFAKQLKVVN